MGNEDWELGLVFGIGDQDRDWGFESGLGMWIRIWFVLGDLELDLTLL